MYIYKYGNVTYEYDKLGRLTKEINPTIDRIKIWCYDISGNITSRTEHKYTTGEDLGTFIYEYDSVWKDRLKSIGGQTISYQDDVANPTIYKGATLTWERGRLLHKYNSIEMEYDASGIRREKVVPVGNDKTTTTYIYDGDKLIKEVQSGNSTCNSIYLYNSQGIIGFVHDGITYAYRKNLFGDIIALYRGATKVAEYRYDAWGNCKVFDGNSNEIEDLYHIAHVNPFRYRGYYWDNDLQLYYLMSRYYDPQTGRFINADSLEYLDPETIGGLNLYVYCYNNPTMFIDATGLEAVMIFLEILIAIVFLAVAFSILSGIINSDSNQQVWDDGTILVPASPNIFSQDQDEMLGWVGAQIDAYISSLSNDKVYGTNEKHHIVAKNAKRAGAARAILRISHIDLESDINKVDMKKEWHRVLHTNFYYDLVNLIMVTAYVVDPKNGPKAVLVVLNMALGGNKV